MKGVSLRGKSKEIAVNRWAKTWWAVVAFCCLLALWSPQHLFADQSERLFRIVQISDTQPPLGNEEAWEKAEQSIELVNKLKPDFVIFPGDITCEGTEPEYEHMNEIIAKIEVPVHLVPGNHDTVTPASDAERARTHHELRQSKLPFYHKHFGPDAWSFEYGDYLFVGFDCTEIVGAIGHSWGTRDDLTRDRRDWLDARLSESAKPYKVVVAHYPYPSPRSALGEVLAAHRVAAYMHGHVHQVEAFVDSQTGRLILDSGSAVHHPAYGVLCVDVYPDLWQVTWYGVQGEVQDMGTFDMKENLAQVARLATFTKGPYIQNLTPTSAIIKWETTARPDSSVLFRKAGDEDWTSALIAPSRTLHEARLTGLMPGTEYQYQADYRSSASGDNESAMATFRTPEENPLNVRFVVYGDTRSVPEDHRKVVRAVLDRTGGRIDFVIHTGDLVTDGRRYSFWGPEFFGPLKELAGSIPIYTVLGNHEVNSENYFDLFALPGNERFYSRDFGPVHVSFLDSCWPLAPGSEQYEWFVSDVAASDAPWKLVVFHHPVFTSGPHGGLGEDGRPAELPIRHLQEHYVPLFEQYDVAMTFSGHDHLYERNYKDGVYYVTTGGGGAPLYDVEQNKVQNPYSQVLLVTHHYCLVEVDKDTLRMSVFDTENSLLDKVELTRQAKVSSQEQSVKAFVAAQ